MVLCMEWRESKGWPVVRASRLWIRPGTFLVVVLLASVCVLPRSDARSLDCESAEACFRYAAAFAREHPDQTLLQVNHFRSVQEAYPGTIWAKRAGLRIGWSLLEREPARAIAYLRAAREDFPLLEDYVLLKLGRALGRVGSLHESALTFESALELSVPSVLSNETSYESGFAWFENGQCQAAIAHLERATSGDPDSPSAPRAFSVLAECAARLQDVPGAKAALGELWRTYPESPEAQAVDHIVQSGQPGALPWTPSLDDYFERGHTWYGAARFEAAIRDLRKFLAGRSHGPRSEQGLFRLGMAHVRLKQYVQAEPIFRRLLTLSSEYAGQAAVWLAKAYLRRDQGRLLLQFRDSVPPGVSANARSRIRWLSGVWAEGEDAIPQAVLAYSDAYRVAELPAIKTDALWRLGWLHYQQGAWDDAVEAFRLLAATAAGWHWRNRAQYWEARALERMGRADEAQALYGRVSADWPMTYYGQLSGIRLRRPLHAGRDHRASEAVRTMYGPASSAVRINPHFQKAMELSRLGLRREAVEELSAVKAQYGDQPQTLYALAQHMLAVEDYASPIVIAARHFREPLKRRRIAFDSLLWRMAYPTGYLPTIRRYADGRVDPLLVAGLIREESLYDPGALSAVGAMGLMQLMPETANRVALRLGLGSPDREDLLDGAMNIRLGVDYVGELLRDYQGNLIRAVAAYNAGPDAVNRWIARFGNRDPDEFVELISYRETRRYVKRVLTSYRIYHILHSTTCSALALDRAC